MKLQKQSALTFLSKTWCGREGYIGVSWASGCQGSYGRGINLGCHIGARGLGCSGAVPAQQPVHAEAWSNYFPLPFNLGWRERSVLPWWVGTKAISSIIFDPNSAFRRALWSLPAAHPSLSELLPLSLHSPSHIAGKFARGEGGLIQLADFFFILICVHFFPDALWGEGEEIFISPLSMRITKILKYHLEVLKQWTLHWQ